MLPRRGSCTVLLALPLVLACQRGGPAPLSDADKNALRANDQKFAQGALAKNWAALAARYASDASFMPPNEALVKGPAAIRTWMEAFPPITAFTVDAQEVDGIGDLAYVRGTYTMSVTPPGAPGPVQDHGKYVEILRKQPDGSWLMTSDIFNSDVALAPPPAARK